GTAVQCRPVNAEFHSANHQITKSPNHQIANHQLANRETAGLQSTLAGMFRQRTGSVVCASCGSLVGVNDDRCYNCGRRNPGLWGFGPALRRFGNDLGFLSLVLYGCSALYLVSLAMTVATGGNLFS